MLATMPSMARPRKKKATEVDRHKPAKMVRIPEVLAKQLEELRKRHVTNITTEVVAAIRMYLEKHELWPPKP